MKLYKDLRGVMMSCNDRRSYNIVYEALYGNPVIFYHHYHYHISIHYYDNQDELS